MSIPISRLPSKISMYSTCSKGFVATTVKPDRSGVPEIAEGKGFGSSNAVFYASSHEASGVLSVAFWYSKIEQNKPNIAISMLLFLLKAIF
jgi:hypothetical protein